MIAPLCKFVTIAVALCAIVSFSVLSAAAEDTISAEEETLFDIYDSTDHYLGEETPHLPLPDCCEGTCFDCCPTNCAPPPTMIGDSLGVPFVINDSGVGGPLGVHHFPNFYSKVADNNSAVPQDRVFINYKFFNDVDTYKTSFPGPDEARDLSLYEIGIEKTFEAGLFSFEMILPVSYSPNTNFNGNDAVRTPQEQLELQNFSFGLKVLLSQDADYAFSAGCDSRHRAPTLTMILATHIVTRTMPGRSHPISRI